MGTRIEIELTSKREDGSWNWRASGARQPKGVLDGSLLYEGAKVGDVVRAEADVDIDGIYVTAVSPPRAKRGESDRVELLVTSAPENLVTTSLVEKRERPRRPRAPEGERPRRPARGRAGDRREAIGETPGAPRRERPRRPSTGERAGVAASTERREARARPKRLSPASVHRDAVMATLSPEQRPVAEQILRGGLPSVRQAVEEQNRQARAEGRPEIPAGPLLAMAEDLLPRLKAAEWKDRAEAAARVADEISIRDLRSVVVGAEVSVRDDADRLLASSLRETLERRVAKVRQDWMDSISAALDEGRLVRALNLSSRPPDPTARIPAELALRMREEAGKAMSPDVSPDRWITLLEAVANSPVRRTVKPVGLPPQPGQALLEAARQASGRIPELSRLLGIEMPPPPGPPRKARRVPPAPAGRGRRGSATEPEVPAASPEERGGGRDQTTSGENGGTATAQSAPAAAPSGEERGDQGSPGATDNGDGPAAHLDAAAIESTG